MTDELPLLADVLHELAQDEELVQLAQAVRAGTTVWATPVPNAARRAVVATVFQRLHQSTLVITPTPDTALRMHADLGCWLGSQRVLIFPPSDALPYEHMSTDVSVLIGRLQVLEQLHSTAEPCVVVTSIRALLQPTLAPAELAAALRTLQQGQRCEPRQLLEHWIRLGYRMAPTAEQPGEVSSRGGIIDIYPLTSSRPVRLEWWGDELESLRLYDPLTQRSERRVRSVTIGPPHEIPLWQDQAALKAIQTLDLGALRPEIQAEWQAAQQHIQHGERFEGRAFFAPFFRSTTNVLDSSLLAYLPTSALVFFSEAQTVWISGQDFEQQAEQARINQIEGAELPNDFPPALVGLDQLYSALKPLAQIHLSLQPPDAAPPEAVAYELSTFTPAPSYGAQLERLLDDLRERLISGTRAVIITPQAARLRELSNANHLALIGFEAGPDSDLLELKSGTLAIRYGNLSGGWYAHTSNLLLLTDSEVFGWRSRRAISTRARKERTEAERATFLQSLNPGDYVVHVEHGIARYDGLTRLAVGEMEREFMLLSYASGDKLYVPIDQVDRVARYVGAGEGKPTLTRLGTSDWERTKQKVRKSIEELAGELLELYAARTTVEGHTYSPDTTWQRELEDSFPYNETDDQLRALEEVKHDMESSRPMDRLICGDVGYGKTEVALRAAFKAVQDGMQVAVLVPTTILAQQHYETFSRRMQAFPVRVEMLSRFRSAARQKTIIEHLARGEIDIIVGTHRLLSKDVSFHKLGLVIIDEEQRFGVRHKERLKQLRQQIDVLTLTATPIPRTMHMALSGIRDLSVIETPPDDRIPIKTYVQPYSEQLVRDAIIRELGRGGQVFYVHNRVQTIYSVASRLQRLLPEARIGVGHGQMAEKELEKVMLQFFDGEFDVLVCTTIIESGLDVSSANTIIIEDATMYGLAQLYQLRGRVGRSTQRGYAYLFYQPHKAMTAEAMQRLEAIQEATQLGAGFRIAMRDLEIRGTGNLLGSEQSGNISAIGFDLYSRLLANAVERVREQSQLGEQQQREYQRERRTQAVEALRRAAILGAHQHLSGAAEMVLPEQVVSIDLPMNAFLPEDYIEDSTLRLRVYQHIADARTAQDVRLLRQELKDRFGALPLPAERLLDLLQIKILALQAGVSSIIADEQEITVKLPLGLTPFERDRLRRELPAAVTIGDQLARLERRPLGKEWESVLRSLLEKLART